MRTTRQHQPIPQQEEFLGRCAEGAYLLAALSLAVRNDQARHDQFLMYVQPTTAFIDQFHVCSRFRLCSARVAMLVHGELPGQDSLLRASCQPGWEERQMVVPSSSQVRLLFELAAPEKESTLWRWDRPVPILSLFIPGGALQAHD